MLTPLHIIFYLYAACAVASGVMVVTARNPVRSVLSLVVTFFAMAGVWMTLRAEFLSLILLLVYVGAVMTLFLFVVMMLSISRETKRDGFVRYLPIGIIMVVLMTTLIAMALYSHYVGFASMPAPAALPSDYSNVAQLGELLFTDYVFPFELAGVLLLAAIIAAITLTHRPPQHRKVQRPSDQINIRREDRVRLVKGD